MYFYINTIFGLHGLYMVSLFFASWSLSGSWLAGLLATFFFIFNKYFNSISCLCSSEGGKLGKKGKRCGWKEARKEGEGTSGLVEEVDKGLWERMECGNKKREEERTEN